MYSGTKVLPAGRQAGRYFLHFKNKEKRLKKGFLKEKPFSYLPKRNEINNNLERLDSEIVVSAGNLSIDINIIVFFFFFQGLF
jgi:hypothetical protein